jgi:hypothetical protein
MMDTAVLRRTLDAQEGRTISDAVVEGLRTQTSSLGLLDRGKGPFRWDFRWTFRVVREDLGRGGVLLRYDLLPAPAPERVAVFQGAAVLEPDGDGARITEAVVLGTDVSLPFFLVGPAREGVADMLEIRAKRLAREMR